MSFRDGVQFSLFRAIAAYGNALRTGQVGGTVEVGKWRLDGLTSLQKKSGLEQGWSELIRSGRRGWTRSQEIAITDQGETVVEEESKTFQTFEPTLHVALTVGPLEPPYSTACPIRG